MSVGMCVCVCVCVCVCPQIHTQTLLEVVISILFHFNISTRVDIAKIKIVSKMVYMTPIEEAGLSSKEKPLKSSRGRIFDQIIFKFHTHVGLIEIQILCEN